MPSLQKIYTKLGYLINVGSFIETEFFNEIYLITIRLEESACCKKSSANRQIQAYRPLIDLKGYQFNLVSFHVTYPLQIKKTVIPEP